VKENAMSVIRKPNRRRRAVEPDAVVALRFHPAAPGERHQRVAVHDHADGVLLFDETLAGAAAWLKLGGYGWVPGSNGVWAKGEAAPTDDGGAVGAGLKPAPAPDGEPQERVMKITIESTPKIVTPAPVPANAGDKSSGDAPDKALWARCRDCAHCWAVAYYPAPLAQVARLAAEHCRCPKCGAAGMVARQEGGVQLEPDGEGAAYPPAP
jgi:hypothetical protein